jgi:hypothetical protein
MEEILYVLISIAGTSAFFLLLEFIGRITGFLPKPKKGGGFKY